LIEPEGSVSCLQDPAIVHFLTQINPIYGLPTDYLTSILILSFSLHLGLSSAHTAYQCPEVKWHWCGFRLTVFAPPPCCYSWVQEITRLRC